MWWQVYPLGFTGAQPAGPTGAQPAGPADGPSGGPTGAPPARHRLRQLERWLDYAVGLGCSGLLLGPIFAALSHGYDTTNHFRIDPALAGDRDFHRPPPPPPPPGGAVRFECAVY